MAHRASTTCAAWAVCLVLHGCGFVPAFGSRDSLAADAIDTSAPVATATSQQVVETVVSTTPGQVVARKPVPGADAQPAATTAAATVTTAAAPAAPRTPVTLPAAPLAESVVVSQTPRRVPASMIGLHSYTYPVALVPYHGYQATAPTFPYGLRRSLNYDGVFWHDIHRGSDPSGWNWAGLDGVIEDAYRKNVQFMYTFMYTPAHLRSPGMEAFPSPAPNWPGSTSMPNNLQEVADFVTAMVRRYNSGGVRKLQYIETWNEPSIDGDNFLASMNVKPYWVGSTADNSAAGKRRRIDDLALLHKTIAVAAKAADPGIRIVAPGWSPGPSAQVAANWLAFFNRPIAGGGTPLQYTDVFAAHPYTTGTSASNMLRVIGDYDDARKAVDASRPLMGTEAGNEGPPLSVADHAIVIKRKLLLAAARGYDSLVLYAYEDNDYLGNPWRNAETADAIRQFAAVAVGKIMVRCAILADGSVWAVFDDGTTMRA